MIPTYAYRQGKEWTMDIGYLVGVATLSPTTYILFVFVISNFFLPFQLDLLQPNMKKLSLKL